MKTQSWLGLSNLVFFPLFFLAMGIDEWMVGFYLVRVSRRRRKRREYIWPHC